MANKLIRFADGTVVQVEVIGNEVQHIAGGAASRVDTTMEIVKPLLVKICQPILEAVREVQIGDDFERVEVEVGIGFDFEGNMYIARMNVGANILIKMTLRNRL